MLATPLEDLSRHCRAVTEGDLNARAAPSSIAEIDQVASTHNEMLRSLSELLRRERDFTATASHQLRTPLTGLQLTLEAGLQQDDDARLRPLLAEALTATQRLHRTVEEVLRLSRPQDTPRLAAGQVAVTRLPQETQERWHGLFADDGRHLECGTREVPADVRVPGGPVSEVLGVLLDNARTHGRGTTRSRYGTSTTPSPSTSATRAPCRANRCSCSTEDRPATDGERASAWPSPATWPSPWADGSS
nr:HAMP domain-containing sensor histidine kinase [Streptomyces endocoffeicus]